MVRIRTASLGGIACVFFVAGRASAGLLGGGGGGELAAVAPAVIQPSNEAQEPASAKKRPKVYDESADARKQITAALARAKRENRRVLIQWGGNWCTWCLRLHDLCQRDDAIRKELSYEYEVVHVDAGLEEKNMDLLREYKADMEHMGFPYLTILDADGSVVVNQETGSLEIKDEHGESVLGEKMGHQPGKVLEFLKAHEATPLDASRVMGGALTRAKADQKRVFVHFGAPWCGWCRKLDEWLLRDDVSSLVAKDFVEVKIDIDRMAGAKAVYERYNHAADKTGIPWFCVLEPSDSTEGKVLATSMAGDGKQGKNIGFPAAEDEITHFKSMLASTARRLTPAEIETLVGTLKPRATPAAAAPTAGGVPK